MEYKSYMQYRSSKAIFNFLASFEIFWTLQRLRFSVKYWCVSDIALVMVCNDNVNKFH